MLKYGYERCKYDNCIYFKLNNFPSLVYLLLYVDDMLIFCNNECEIKYLMSYLYNEFEMKILDQNKRVLDMDIIRVVSGLFLLQQSPVEKVIEVFQCLILSM